MAALLSKGSAGDVVAPIAAEFARVPACGRCGSEASSKWGVASGVSRPCAKPTMSQILVALTVWDVSGHHSTSRLAIGYGAVLRLA